MEGVGGTVLAVSDVVKMCRKSQQPFPGDYKP